MADKNSGSLARAMAEGSHPLMGAAGDYDALLDMIGEARLVLLGEASHGTHEFYQARCEISQRLIREKGFNAVAVEADWPDAYRVNCYINGVGDASDNIEALAGFSRFPQWMWRNRVVADFVRGLRQYNDSLSNDKRKVGFYGLDLYNMSGSMEAVINYLAKIDPAAAQRARERYSCFGDPEWKEPEVYGYTAAFGAGESCHNAVVQQLIELQRQAAEQRNQDGRMAEDEAFYAEQNARLVKNAEEYYREMYLGHVSSWNIRDCHMAETLDHLLNHLDRKVGRSKIIVWAHNSHLGDARATEMGRAGELNVGQKVRERYGEAAFLLGFSTYTGTVTAASDWDRPAELKRVRPGMAGSYEALFHDTGSPAFLLDLRQNNSLAEELNRERLERAIGVIYRPDTERRSHYFKAHLTEQFDAVIFFDETRAVEPLEPTPQWQLDEPPETFPSSL